MATVFFIGVITVCAIFFLLIAHLLSCRGGSHVQGGSGHAVLITGSDSGFGHQLAQSLARESSGNLKILKLDVTRDEDVQQAKQTVQDNLPEKGEVFGLWAVVNNAGISDWAEIEWSSVGDFRSMVDIDLFGSIRTWIAFLPMVCASKGRMVYVSSIFAFFNCLNMGAYSVSKRGLEAFADCLRVEMDSFGVKVSIIQPGHFGRATNILRMKTDEQKQVFNRQYTELATEYFMSTCNAGFKNTDVVVNAMLDAITSPKPKYRYLLLSKVDLFLFKAFPYLPTGFPQPHVRQKKSNALF
ncbi:D-beta-hydroxybutyrate dehydrogenase, mitochondrial [Diretmus argenteus]